LDELTIIASIIIGALVSYVIIVSRRKMWYLETMNPRQHYELGREKKIIANLTINGHHFHGIEVGKYRVLLLFGDLATFSKPVLKGKIEQMYMQVLSETLLKKSFVTRIERLRLFNFIYRRIPSLTAKAYMITGELISPTDVLDYWWKQKDERDKALTEMRKRRLISPTILWVKPYPPEEKLFQIMKGTLTIPDIISQHNKQYEELTVEQRNILIKTDEDVANLLKILIPLARDVITSISDPIQVIAMVIADRARKISGLGLEQLTEKGGVDSVIKAAQTIRRYKKELSEALGEVSAADINKLIEPYKARIAELESRLKKLEAKPKITAT